MTTATNARPRCLYLMQVGTLPPMGVPFVCYLIQMDDGKNILIDTGLPEGVNPPPGRQMPDLGENVVQQLAKLGIQPNDIDLLISTHYDGDHVGNHPAFPRAEYIVQRAHHTAAQTHPRYLATRALWDQPAERIRLVDGDTELLPGVELIETSGHAPGHQSVLVRLPETGVVILAIDAVGTQTDFKADRVPGQIDDNAADTLTSTHKLIDLAEREHAALVVFGHDPVQWSTLKKLPDSYC